jgi:protein ImuB
MRVACLLVPDLPLRAWLRGHPEERGLPVAISSGADARADVLDVSAEARAAGVLARTSVSHARASCAELRVCVVSLALNAAARDALLDLAFSFSPRAELAPECEGLFSNEAAVFLDAGAQRWASNLIVPTLIAEPAPGRSVNVRSARD